MPDHDWHAAHRYLDSLQLPVCPIAGTSEWAALAADDPRKLGALAIAGVWWVLAQDLEQDARKQTAIDVAEATDWTAHARRFAQHAEFYAQHPDLKRKAS